MSASDARAPLAERLADLLAPYLTPCEPATGTRHQQAVYVAREVLAFVAERQAKMGETLAAIRVRTCSSDCQHDLLCSQIVAERLPTREETARLLNANSGTPWDELGQGALSDLFEKAAALLRDLRERLG